MYYHTTYGYDTRSYLLPNVRLVIYSILDNLDRSPFDHRFDCHMGTVTRTKSYEAPTPRRWSRRWSRTLEVLEKIYFFDQQVSSFFGFPSFLAFSGLKNQKFIWREECDKWQQCSKKGGGRGGDFILICREFLKKKQGEWNMIALSRKSRLRLCLSLSGRPKKKEE